MYGPNGDGLSDAGRKPFDFVDAATYELLGRDLARRESPPVPTTADPAGFNA